MLDTFVAYWEAIAGSTVLASALGYGAVTTVRKIERHEREKADREEIKSLMERMDRDREETRDSLRRLHDKLDHSISTQTEINIQMAAFRGRMEGV